MFKLNRVETKKDWADFIDLPWKIYKGDPNWVPPLRIAVRDTLDVSKNPFFKHSYMYPIIAYNNKGEYVGRIVGVIDDNHNQFHNEKTAFFGFFECIDDVSLAKQMVEEIIRWSKSKGMTMLRGPMNPSTNHECGLLVEGYDDPPTIMMTYNLAYYGKLLEACGFSKAKDLLAYNVDSKNPFSDRLLAHADRLRKSTVVTFRTVDMKNFDKEVEMILDIYNDAWEQNWGFVPMTPEEFRHMAKDMKAVVDPRLLLIAEVRGQPAAFGLTLPDVNQAMRKIRNGKLLPTGLMKLLWNVKGPGRKKTINRCRILTLGIKKAYRELGIGPLFYAEYVKRAPKIGYPVGEASWILEDNKPMNKALQLMCGYRTKVYRIFDRNLT